VILGLGRVVNKIFAVLDFCKLINTGVLGKLTGPKKSVTNYKSTKVAFLLFITVRTQNFTTIIKVC
jgi:hypothetical protein